MPSQPLNPPAFRIEHPDFPGQPFALAHTATQAETLLRELLQQAEGFVCLPNEKPALVDATTPSAPPDTLEGYISELIQKHGNRDDAFVSLRHAVIIADRIEAGALAAIAAAKRAHTVVQATPPPEPVFPMVCPFKVGNLVHDEHSGLNASVHEINDKRGFMIVLTSDQAKNKVPDFCYGAFKLVEENTPKNFFDATPKPKRKR